MTTFTCIVCPKGCRLSVDEAGGVMGAGCPKGISYAYDEYTHPMRTVTTTVRLEGAEMRMLPVKTAHAVPKEKMRAVVDALSCVHVPVPVQGGQVIMQNAAGTGVDVIATRTVPKG